MTLINHQHRPAMSSKNTFQKSNRQMGSNAPVILQDNTSPLSDFEDDDIPSSTKAETLASEYGCVPSFQLDRSPPMCGAVPRSPTDRSPPICYKAPKSHPDRSPPMRGTMPRPPSDRSPPICDTVPRSPTDRSPPMCDVLPICPTDRSPPICDVLPISPTDRSPPMCDTVPRSPTDRSPPICDVLPISPTDRAPPLARGGILRFGKHRMPTNSRKGKSRHMTVSKKKPQTVSPDKVVAVKKMVNFGSSGAPDTAGQRYTIVNDCRYLTKRPESPPASFKGLKKSEPKAKPCAPTRKKQTIGRKRTLANCTSTKAYNPVYQQKKRAKQTLPYGADEMWSGISKVWVQCMWQDFDGSSMDFFQKMNKLSQDFPKAKQALSAQGSHEEHGKQ
jgi:hypothetical protein